MTDETPEKRTHRREPTGDGAAPPASAAPGDVASGGADDSDAALMRLESMGGESDAPASSAALPPTPAIATVDDPSSRRPSRPMGAAQRTPRDQPRAAAVPRSTQAVARIAVPVVFLIAVIALIGIVTQSGVVGGSDEATPTPGPKATHTKAGSTTTGTKKYVVKSGDSMSSIAARFNTSVSELEALNPDLGTTLVVGTKIVVPTQ